MTNLKDVKIGSWLDDGSGVYEVVSEYDAYHNWYLVKEVIFNNDDNYYLDDVEIKMTKNEVKNADLLN